MQLLITILMLVVASAAYAQDELPEHQHALPFFTSADSPLQGFARIINRSGRAGNVRIHAIDNTGERYGPVELYVEAGETTHFNSQDLEGGNSSKGLSGGVGDGEGHWWLDLRTNLDIQPNAYIRTADGFVTSMHDVVPRTPGLERHNLEYGYRVVFSNNGSNQNQRSLLRLVNPNNVGIQGTIIALDDAGVPGDFRHSSSLGAGTAQMITSEDLEDWDFGDGHGKWQLTIYADNPIWIMSLVQSPTGHLTNLSTPAPELTADDPLLPGVPPTPTGFTASPGFGIVFLKWDNPSTKYDNHASTWIYRSRTNDFNTAERIGTDEWILYVDRTVEPDTTYYYWIRWQSTDGVLSDPASHGAAHVRSAPLEEIGEITAESEHEYRYIAGRRVRYRKHFNNQKLRRLGFPGGR